MMVLDLLDRMLHHKRRTQEEIESDRVQLDEASRPVHERVLDELELFTKQMQEARDDGGPVH